MTGTRYVVYHGSHRIEGGAQTIASILAEQGLPVCPGELDDPDPEVARMMLDEFVSMGLITYREES